MAKGPLRSVGLQLDRIATSRGGAWNRSRVRRAFTAELYLQSIEAQERSVEDDAAELLAYREFCSEYIGRRGRVRAIEKGLAKTGAKVE